MQDVGHSLCIQSPQSVNCFCGISPGRPGEISWDGPPGRGGRSRIPYASHDLGTDRTVEQLTPCCGLPGIPGVNPSNVPPRFTPPGKYGLALSKEHISFASTKEYNIRVFSCAVRNERLLQSREQCRIERAQNPHKNQFYRFPHGADTDLPHMAKFPNKLQLMPGERF